MAAMVAFVACDDTKTPLGSSLVKDKVEIVIDSSFTVTGRSVVSDQVQARTILQLLGSITAPPYGTFSSSVVTQFMPTENIVTEGVEPSTIDSVKLLMRVPLAGFVGDSLAAMGITAYPLTRQLPAAITSAFNPDGYYDPSRPLASTMYSMAPGPNDTIARAGYRLVSLDLGKEFGRTLFEKYKSSPSTFSTPGAFAQWFPGVCLTTTFGSGRVAQIDSTVITMYYRQILPIDDPSNPRDTTIFRSNSYLAVAPEILTNNNMTYAMADALRRRAENGEALLVAPVGYDVELRFPARDLVDRFRSAGTELSVINTLTFTIPVEEITNSYGITPPPFILMVKKSKKDEFFAKSLLPDQVTSFYAAYDSYRRQYVFNDMRDYLLDVLTRDAVTDDDEEFVLCPVTIGFEQTGTTASSYNYYYYYYGVTPESTQTVGTVTPYVNRPSMAKLSMEKAKISFTFSVQKSIF